MADHGGSVARGLALLAERMTALPDALRAATRTALPAPTTLLPGPFAVTGAGGSEGPARILSDRLARAGLASRFVPLSAFVGPSSPVTADDRLVIVSQGLSPNARLALTRRADVARCVVITATDPDPAGDERSRALAAIADEGHTIVLHGPPREGELLVRILGPAVATLIAMRLAGELTGHSLEVSELGATVARAFEAVPGEGLAGGTNTALIVAGDGGVAAHGLRWKILEALELGDPPIWDVLQFAHGPLQQYFDRPATLITLEREDSSHAELFDRLSTTAPPHHRLVRLRATLPEPLCWFEHDAMLNALVLRELERSPRDLVQWPGKGRDAALYAIERPLKG